MAVQILTAIFVLDRMAQDESDNDFFNFKVNIA